MGFSPKNILIISPEPWGKSKVSKHHYALACAKEGHNVFFLTTVNTKSHNEDEVCEDNSNIKLIYFCLSKLINLLRFHWRWAYLKLLKSSLHNFLKDYPHFDVLISFDCNGVFTKLSNFKAKHTIFFPVDQVNQIYRKEYSGFDELISISPVILESFPNFKNTKLIHHGLSPDFVKNDIEFVENSNLKTVAYVGNLLIGPILDKISLKTIIAEHSDIQFHFFGAYDSVKNNLGSDTSEATTSFISFLKQSSNCILHGIVSSKVLSEELTNMDAFLVCYDYRFDKNKCSNSHKILEYLSTGKPLISTRVSMYDDLQLFPMLNTFDNAKFPEFFKQNIKNWDIINTKSAFDKRITFAHSNSYDKKMSSILNRINF